MHSALLLGRLDGGIPFSCQPWTYTGDRRCLSLSFFAKILDGVHVKPTNHLCWTEGMREHGPVLLTVTSRGLGLKLSGILHGEESQLDR